MIKCPLCKGYKKLKDAKCFLCGGTGKVVDEVGKYSKLTKKQFDKMYKAVSTSPDKIIGFIGGDPVIAREDCPPGVIYMVNEKEIAKLGRRRK